jgi:hypothetical protein
MSRIAYISNLCGFEAHQIGLCGWRGQRTLHCVWNRWIAPVDKPVNIRGRRRAILA